MTTWVSFCGLSGVGSSFFLTLFSPPWNSPAPCWPCWADWFPSSTALRTPFEIPPGYRWTCSTHLGGLGGAAEAAGAAPTPTDAATSATTTTITFLKDIVDLHASPPA